MRLLIGCVADTNSSTHMQSSPLQNTTQPRNKIWQAAAAGQLTSDAAVLAQQRN